MSLNHWRPTPEFIGRAVRAGRADAAEIGNTVSVSEMLAHVKVCKVHSLPREHPEAAEEWHRWYCQGLQDWLRANPFKS